MLKRPRCHAMNDNLLVNDASITQSGQNNIVATTADIDAMLAGAASGQVTLPQSVLEDPAFRDLPVVRVLHIEGDLVSVNILRQTILETRRIEFNPCIHQNSHMFLKIVPKLQGYGGCIRMHSWNLVGVGCSIF